MNHAERHRYGLDYLLMEEPQLLNHGNGQGQSIRDVVMAMEAPSNRSIHNVITDRRPCDAAISIADPTKEQL